MSDNEMFSFLPSFCSVKKRKARNIMYNNTIKNTCVYAYIPCYQGLSGGVGTELFHFIHCCLVGEAIHPSPELPCTVLLICQQYKVLAALHPGRFSRLSLQ